MKDCDESMYRREVLYLVVIFMFVFCPRFLFFSTSVLCSSPYIFHSLSFSFIFFFLRIAGVGGGSLKNLCFIFLLSFSSR